MKIGCFLFLTALAASRAQAQSAPRPFTAPQLVRLWNQQVIANLENQNQIDALCPPALAPALRADCRKEKLQPKKWKVALYEKPSDRSKEIGTLVLTATPGQGLSYEFVPAGGGAASKFVPDLFDSDWGYGPYADHTVLAREGDWVLLPARPFPRPAWLDLKAGLGSGPDLYDPVDVGQVYELDGRHRTVKEAREDGLLLRDELPSDMPCYDSAGSPATAAEPKAVLFPWAKLYDGDGHLKLLKAYTRGC